MRTLIVVLLTLVLSGCGKPTVDASSEEAMAASIEEMKSGMTPEERAEFEDAAQVVLMSEVDIKGMMQAALRGEELDSDEMIGDMKGRLDGMTADDIVAEADRIKKERETKQIEEMRSEIAELESQLANMLEDKRQAEALKSEINKIGVSKTRLYWRDPGKYSYTKDLILEVTVTNNLDTAISRVLMTGTLATPGRKVPWLVEDFNYQIAGGLEPGETQTWSLAPNEYSGDWRNTPKDRDDTVFTVEVRNVEGPDGEKLFDISYDQAAFEKASGRLEKLRSALEELGS